jgi:hypothetical protein
MTPAVNPEAQLLDERYRLVLLQKEDERTPLRICLVVKINAQALGGAFVLIRETADASVYLAAMTDAAGRVHEWLELWVQDVDHFAASYPGYRDAATNPTLDARWTQRAEAFRTLEPASFLALGWEAAPAPRIFFDVNLRAPADSGVDSWELCRNDELLAKKGLPPFSTSLSRYLYQPSAGLETVLVPITAEAPLNDATRPFAEAFPGLLSLNAGGRMLARTYAPIGFEQWVDILSGIPWAGVAHGGDVVRLGGVYRTLRDASAMQFGGGHLFLGNRGLAGRLAETFHLKLHAIAAAFRLVFAHVQASQLPLLNVSDDSFRVSLSESDTALPFLWNFRTTMVLPGEAMALAVASTEARYFVPARYGGTSIYRPTTLHPPVEAVGEVLIRKVDSGKPSEIVLEGTLVTQERFTAGGSDLLWLRLKLPLGRIDLYARTEVAEGSAAGELRFRTLPQELSAAAVTALQQAEGVVFPHVQFQSVPLLSSPCDLYALGVLAVRTLLVDEESALPVALDEIFSLARQAAATYDPDQPAGERLRAHAFGHPNVNAALGPHRLVHEKIAPEGVLFPPELWWDTLAVVVRCFPGLGPDSYCRDFGDVQPLALESVFSEPMAALDQLLVRSRSLITVDWSYNREIRSVIGKFLGRVTATASH